MAVQSVPNNQITTYVHNGFRNDVNKVNMPFGKGMPLQNVFNFLVSPVLDSGNGTISAAQAVVVGGNGQPLNPNPSAESGALTTISNQSIFGTQATPIAEGTSLVLNQANLSNFSAATAITIGLTLSTAGVGQVQLQVFGFLAPGYEVGETLLYDATLTTAQTVITKYRYTSLSSIKVVSLGNTGNKAVINPAEMTGTVTVVTNAQAVSLLNPPDQTFSSVGSTTLSSVVSAFPAQMIPFNISLSNVATGSSNAVISVTGISGGTSITQPVDVAFTNTAGNLVGSGATAANFTSVSAISVTNLPTGVNNLTIYSAVQGFETSVTYRSLNGQMVSQLDCQRCIVLALTTTTNVNPITACNVVITGYDDRLIQVQETLSIPAVQINNTTLYFTSNKAYSYIQSIVFRQNPTLGANGTVAVSASNQFFGLPFYFSNDGVMTVSEPAISGPMVGAVNVSVSPGNNFYATTPNANAVISQNTLSGSSGTISTLDARGILALGSELISSSNILSYVAYIYAADSFINVQLQNTQNPMAQQQTSNWVTGTTGAVVNSPTYEGWGLDNWATTQLIDFDLTGCQFPGDQAQYNNIFNNNQFPAPIRRLMGSAI